MCYIYTNKYIICVAANVSVAEPAVIAPHAAAGGAMTETLRATQPFTEISINWNQET